MEVWKKIKGFEDYEVSSHGNIRRLYLKGYKYRKPVIQHGYHSITFVYKKNSFKKTLDLLDSSVTKDPFDSMIVSKNDRLLLISGLKRAQNDTNLRNQSWINSPLKLEFKDQDSSKSPVFLKKTKRKYPKRSGSKKRSLKARKNIASQRKIFTIKS